MTVTRETFFARSKRKFNESGGWPEDWEAVAEKKWTAMQRALTWFDQPMPQGCAFVWPDHEEPECFRTWDLYSLDDYDYVALTPPGSYHNWCAEEGAFGCCTVDHIDLPNGWTIHVGYHS